MEKRGKSTRQKGAQKKRRKAQQRKAHFRLIIAANVCEAIIIQFLLRLCRWGALHSQKLELVAKERMNDATRSSRHTHRGGFQTHATRPVHVSGSGDKTSATASSISCSSETRGGGAKIVESVHEGSLYRGIITPSGTS